MKTITVGDIHGNDAWKVIKPEEWDKIIFVGDYVDEWTALDKKILDNLLDILAFKRDYPDKVVLLLGNHDLQYMFSYSKYGCSGYRPSMYPALHDLFNKEKKLFDPIFVIKADDGHNYVWTHAGIHQGWYGQAFYPKFVKKYDLQDLDLEFQVRSAFLNEEYTLFQVGHLRGGYESVGGIFWADRRLTSKKPKKYLHQIVGHTKVDKIHTIDFDMYTSITFVDCLQEISDFYEFEIY